MLKGRKGSNHPNWKGGNTKCIDCDKLLTHRHIGTRCHRCASVGDRNPAWTGGKRVTEQGYVFIYSPDHPTRKNKRNKGMLEHRLVMEEKIGRYLLPDEIVHHLNGIRTDNRVENLVVTTRPEHESGTLLKLTREQVVKLENEIIVLKKLLYETKSTI